MRLLHHTLDHWPDAKSLGAAAAAEEVLESPAGSDERAASEEGAGEFEVLRETKSSILSACYQHLGRKLSK